jgi:hypothetical protein
MEVICMGDVQGPEKVNDTCVETTHAGMMNRGFTVLWKLSNAMKFPLLWVFKNNACRTTSG